MTRLAETVASSSTLDVGILAQYGILGLVCAALFLYSKSAMQRERERADRLEAQNQKLNDSMAERVIPALTSATRAIEESQALLAAMQREREALRQAALLLKREGDA